MTSPANATPAALPLLDGKVVVVSGVGPGLGRSVAVRSAQAGARVVLAARTESRLASVAEEIRAMGGTALAVPTDLTDDGSVANLVDAALAEFGVIDAVVHNAFVQPAHVRLLDADFQAVRQGIDINLLAALNLTRKLAPALARSHGSVVMINSMVLRNQLPNLGAYRVMKSGLLALARSLSVELGPMGVRVNSVAPGYIWADSVKRMFERQAADRGVPFRQVYDEVAASTDLRRLPEPDDIANAVVFLASDFARAIAGQCLDVNCGHTHH
ncbi:SDR family oxidoreductase [Prescottella agglutinans]|uniref:NAD(P)-dependent dehydrogenase (Short-subunit alcohol dehydrogenase family) n=1 Tax=Prescottella agglutinans TaxID=1644129 RepID=A0ABT6MEB6_9NOCA|nr:SDR family oxidoreductase [Prescottella agglutinans]MDH6282622.1 NAD(P)-dependent dehydrogenase (short-subunit alcohol dehydrogenase family) [Prescottella agglutinans]